MDISIVIVSIIIICTFGFVITRFSQIKALFDVSASAKKYGFFKTVLINLGSFTFLVFILLNLLLLIILPLQKESYNWTLQGVVGLFLVSLVVGIIIALGTAWRIFLLRKYENWLMKKIKPKNDHDKLISS